MKLTELGKMAEGLINGGNDPNAGVALMVADMALQLARQQLVRLGGDGSGPDGDTIQKAIIEQIDTALERK